MPHAFTRRPAGAALFALGGALLAGCQPGGDYGYDRVSYRRDPAPIEATNPDPPAYNPALAAGPTAQKVVLANAPAGVTQEMADAGQQLYANPCAGCHGPGGTGSPAAPALNDDQWLNVDGSYEQLVQVITSGVASPKQYPGMMPPKGGGSFTDAQVRELAAYVYALSHPGQEGAASSGAQAEKGTS
jgi:mono/diheme cytochrome c family protein